MQVMVVAAHPDDIERHGGGAVARWTQAGCGVVFVLCTSGNRGSDDPEVTPEQLAALREAEQREAAAVVGVTEVVFLRHEDGGLPFVLPQLREDLVRLLRTYRPERVFTHDPFVRSGYFPYQLHPDHRAVGDVALQAVRAHRSQHNEALDQRLRERAEALGHAQGMRLAEGFKYVVLP